MGYGLSVRSESSPLTRFIGVIISTATIGRYIKKHIRVDAMVP